MSRRIFGAFQIRLTEADGAFEKMNVAIHEAGQDQLSFGVDDFRAGPRSFSISASVTDGDDLFAANRHSVRPGLLARLSV